MIQELLYTSAPRGLKPGSRGFCTVMSSRGLSEPLALTLESLSGYRPLFAPSDPRASENPVNWMFLTATVGGKPYWILSRVADYGLDYSQRTNKLAHHLVLDQSDLRGAGPGWVLSQPGVMLQEWQGEPQLLSEIRKLPNGDPPPAPCRAWETLTGDAGWAGVLAECAMSDPVRPAVVIFTPGMDLLALFQEALSLLPPERRWKATFSTYFTNLPQSVSCLWRGMIAGSQEANQSRRITNALRIDLTQPLGPAPETLFSDQARTGRRPQVPQRKVEPSRPAPVVIQASQDDGFAELPDFVDLPANSPEQSQIHVLGGNPHKAADEYRIVPTAPPTLRQKSNRISEYPMELPEREPSISTSLHKTPVIAFFLLSLLAFIGAAGFFGQNHFRTLVDHGKKLIFGQETASSDEDAKNNSNKQEAAKKAEEELARKKIEAENIARMKEEEAKKAKEELAKTEAIKKQQETAKKAEEELARKKIEAENIARMKEEEAKKAKEELAKTEAIKKQQEAAKKAEEELAQGNPPELIYGAPPYFMDPSTREGKISNEALGDYLLPLVDGDTDQYELELYVPNRASHLFKIVRSEKGRPWWDISLKGNDGLEIVIYRIEGSFSSNHSQDKNLKIRPRMRNVDLKESDSELKPSPKEIVAIREILKLSAIRVTKLDRDDWVFLSEPEPKRFTMESDTTDFKKLSDKQTYAISLKDELMNDCLFSDIQFSGNSKPLPRNLVRYEHDKFSYDSETLDITEPFKASAVGAFTENTTLKFSSPLNHQQHNEQQDAAKDNLNKFVPSIHIQLPNPNDKGRPKNIQVIIKSQDFTTKPFHAKGVLYYQIQSTTHPSRVTYAKMMSFDASFKMPSSRSRDSKN